MRASLHPACHRPGSPSGGGERSQPPSSALLALPPTHSVAMMLDLAKVGGRGGYRKGPRRKQIEVGSGTEAHSCPLSRVGGLSHCPFCLHFSGQCPLPALYVPPSTSRDHRQALSVFLLNPFSLDWR